MDLPKFDLGTFTTLTSRAGDAAKIYSNFPSEENRREMMGQYEILNGYMEKFKREQYKGWVVISPGDLHETRDKAISAAYIHDDDVTAVIEVDFYNGMGMDPDAEG